MKLKIVGCCILVLLFSTAAGWSCLADIPEGARAVTLLMCFACNFLLGQLIVLIWSEQRDL